MSWASGHLSCRRRQRGFTVIDVLLTVGLMATLGAITVPPVLRALNDIRTLAAVRYLSACLHRARMTAVARSVDTALRFSEDDGSYEYAVYVDGNGNGLRSREIDDGIDREIIPRQRLGDHFRGVDFGTVPDLPAVDLGGTIPGSDPVRIGSSDLLTFTPLGTASAGSLYVRGPGDAQYVVRVLGETGRIRILKFDARLREWKSL